MKILVKIEKCLILAIVSTKSNFYDGSKKLVVHKINNEKDGATIKKFFGLNPRMHFFLVDVSSEHTK